MEVSLDRFGRILVPKRLRDRLGLKPNARLSIEEVGGSIQLHPLQEVGQMERTKEGILILHGTLDSPIEDPVAWVRDQRSRQILGEP